MSDTEARLIKRWNVGDRVSKKVKVEPNVYVPVTYIVAGVEARKQALIEERHNPAGQCFIYVIAQVMLEEVCYVLTRECVTYVEIAHAAGRKGLIPETGLDANHGMNIVEQVMEGSPEYFQFTFIEPTIPALIKD